MTRLFIVFIFFILHIQFLLEVVIFDVRDFNFWGWQFYFVYPKIIALKAFVFSVLSLFSFLTAYAIAYKKKGLSALNNRRCCVEDLNKIIYTIKLSLLLLFVLYFYIVMSGRFNYTLMVAIREKLNFLFELRIIPLILLSYLMLNYHYSEWFTKKFRKLHVYVAIYVVLIVLIQARSLLFEFGLIVVYPFLKLKRDVFKIKYALILYVISIIPNLIILGRLSSNQVDFYDIDTYKNIFTYEYSIYFNNILGEVLYSTKEFVYGKTFETTFGLLIPSFIRDLLSINIDKSFLSDISTSAGMTGGGFSLLAELYLNFGYCSILIFGIIGYVIGKMNYYVFFVKYVPIKYCIVPIFYGYFILAFRNDAAVFFKQSIFLYIFVVLISYFVYKIHFIWRGKRI